MIDIKLPVSKKSIVEFVKSGIEAQDFVLTKVYYGHIWKEDAILSNVYSAEDNVEAIRIVETLVAYADAIVRIREEVENWDANPRLYGNASMREIKRILDDVEKGYL